MLATLGVERTVIVQPSMYGLDNRCTLDAVRQFGADRARAVVMIDASADRNEIRRLHDAGARGVRFITLAAGGAPLEQLSAVAGRIADFGWHIQMYVTVDTLAELAPRIRELPVPVVFDHMAHLMPDAGAAERELVYRLIDTGRIWVKLTSYRASLSGPPFSDVDPVARKFLSLAPERCLWGSDWPHPKLTDYMPDDGKLIDQLADWTDDENLRRRVLCDNPARLYGFAPPP
jgi:predicted TIM-barrel fold metal-dependent hydrolase